MKHVSFLIALIALAATMVSGTEPDCFRGGVFGNTTFGKLQVDKVCTGMQGRFEHLQERDACVFPWANYKRGDGISWYFNIKRHSDHAGTLTKAVCVAGLGELVDFCSRGGKDKTDSWTFTSDPNEGLCVDIDYINSVNSENQHKKPKANKPQAHDPDHTKESSAARGINPILIDPAIFWDVKVVSRKAPWAAQKKRSDTTIV
ncbi:hypothetical protein BU16DRAFT_594727 [Lophium mytilinum]|uniref:Ecp2 effector protein domain-containing protein n=1 Tax=Lophium mytilinum TaxID=390894 RepID=A0A6A6QJ17_9PEZI|nr:hypothetical protein BU16DRAFT_594727 [Lophium mytilinum]